MPTSSLNQPWVPVPNPRPESQQNSILSPPSEQPLVEPERDQPDSAAMELLVARVTGKSDPLLAFAPEHETTESKEKPGQEKPSKEPDQDKNEKSAKREKLPSTPRRQRTLPPTALALYVLGLIGGVAAAVTYAHATRNLPLPRAVAAPIVTDGALSINSGPDGAQVTIDGTARGTTPLKLTLPAGEHTLVLQNGTVTRSLPVTIEAGGSSSQYVDLAPTGRLEVTSDPAGAQVSIDGAPRGVTPLMVAAISPGQHRVVISRDEASTTRTVTVSAGATAAILASLLPAGSAAGWLSIRAPFEMQVLEDEKIIGTTSADRMMLPVGRHRLELMSASFEYRTGITVQISAGKHASAAVTVPRGLLSVNAEPWADVWVDGQSVGTTPLANLQVPIGNHEVIWRHPQFGERKQSIAVPLETPTRVGVDFSK